VISHIDFIGLRARWLYVESVRDG